MAFLVHRFPTVSAQKRALVPTAGVMLRERLSVLLQYSSASGTPSFLREAVVASTCQLGSRQFSLSFEQEEVNPPPQANRCWIRATMLTRCEIGQLPSMGPTSGLSVVPGSLDTHSPIPLDISGIIQHSVRQGSGAHCYMNSETRAETAQV